jgi:hypothetical protein
MTCSTTSMTPCVKHHTRRTITYLPMPKRYSTFCQVVWGQLQSNLITGQDADAIPSQPAGQVGEDNPVSVFDLDAELSGGKLLQNSTGYFDAVLFAHKPPGLGCGPNHGKSGPRD